MNLIVLPLCAYHFMGPYQYRGLVQGILVHMLIIGLPISLSLNRLGGVEFHRDAAQVTSDRGSIQS